MAAMVAIMRAMAAIREVFFPGIKSLGGRKQGLAVA